MLNRRRFMIALTLPLAGCSYRPLYGRGGRTDVSANLASIAIEEQNTRAGQLLRNELLSTMSPPGADAPQQYRLKLVVTDAASYVSRLPDQPVDRWRYRITSSYELKDTKTGKIVTQGSSQSAVSFDVVREPVSDRQARDAAMRRAAIDLGQDIRLRLSAFLAR